MNTKQINKVSIIKWNATEPGAYVTGIFGVYLQNETAQRELRQARETLVQSGYTILKRDDRECILKNMDTNRTMQMYIEIYDIK